MIISHFVKLDLSQVLRFAVMVHGFFLNGQRELGMISDSTRSCEYFIELEDWIGLYFLRVWEMENEV